MKINCICCGHTLDLGDNYDDYEGQIRCWVCASILAIRTADGKVRSVHTVELSHRERKDELTTASVPLI